MAATNSQHANYHVRVVRSGDWWAITVAELEGLFSQARRLDQTEAMAREAIGLLLEVDESDVGPLDLEIIPSHEAAELLRAVHESKANVEASHRVANEAQRKAAEQLRAQGLPLRDVGTLLGISHQRVSQILAG